MQPLVETTAGAVKGRREVGGSSRRLLHVYRGIPYAAPPIGPLRFRAPEPVPAWGDVRDASSFGASPLQSRSNLFGGVVPGNVVGRVDEDCLTLDVWAPRTGAKLPVLLWFPGGAFLIGGTSVETYDGATLAADHGVVVVSANYRLGALGFLWLGDHGGERLGAVGNPGLRDQLAAMSWTRSNIDRFGGDPDNITAFGESAGAGSLLHLATVPETALLIRRGVLQSPGVDLTLRPEEARSVTETVLGHLDIGPRDVARLWDVPPDTLLDAQERSLVELLAGVSSTPFHPVVDGDLLGATPSVAMAGGAGSDLDLLVTWTRDELRLFPNPAADKASRADLLRRTQRYLGRRLGHDPGVQRSDELLAFYEDRVGGDDPHRGSRLWAALQTDGTMRLPARRIADAHAAAGSTTLVGEFSWATRAREGEWERGAFHAIDLPFTFGTLGRCGWAEFLGAGPAAQRLARQHMAAWAGFAREGRGEIPGLGPWPSYDTRTRRTMLLDEPCSVVEDPLGPVDEAWRGLWSPECSARATAYR